jgi:transposase
VPEAVAAVIASEYKTKHLSAPQLAKEHGYSVKAVRAALATSGVKMRVGRAKLSESDKEKIAKLYAAGESGTALCQLFGVTNKTIYNLLEKLGITRREPGAGGDSLLDAARGTGRFKNARTTTLYAVTLKGYKGYIKFGIAYDFEKRKHCSNQLYSQLLYSAVFKTREDAFIAEQLILKITSGKSQHPVELKESGWIGWREIRKCTPEAAVKLIARAVREIDDKGLWMTAMQLLAKTDAEKDACSQRLDAG